MAENDFANAIRRTPPPAAIEEETAPIEQEPRRGRGRPKGARNKRKCNEADSRDKLRQVAAYLDEHTKMRLRLIGIVLDRTVQDLIEEAINGIFTRYEKQARARIDDGGDRDVE